MDPHEIIAKLGMFWPDGNPGQLRHAGGAYRQCARDALDYRTSLSSPGVVYLTEAVRSPWRQVAASMDELLSRLTG